MALPVGLTGTTPRTSFGGLHSWLNELHGSHNLFFNGDFSNRQFRVPSSDTAVPAATSYGVPGLLGNQARRFTMIDGEASNPIKENLTSAYMSRVMSPTGGGAIEAPTSTLQVVVENFGGVGPGGFLSANALVTWAVSHGTDADNLGVGGVGLLIEDALSSLKAVPDGNRYPNAFGMFAEGVTESPFGFACAINPFIAVATNQPYSTVGPFSAANFTQSFAISRHIPVTNTITFVNGSATITSAVAHGYAVGRTVTLSTTGTLPVNFNPNIIYFVKTVLSPTTFELSLTLAGAAISAGSAGAGTHFVTDEPTAIFSGGSAVITTDSPHRMIVGDSLMLLNIGGGLPVNFSADTFYYVVSVPASNQFTISATLNGAAIVAGSAGTGVQVWYPFAQCGPAHLAYGSYPSRVQYSEGYLSAGGSTYWSSFRSLDSSKYAMLDEGSHIDGWNSVGANYSGNIMKFTNDIFGISKTATLNVVGFENGYGFVHDKLTHRTYIYHAGNQVAHSEANGLHMDMDFWLDGHTSHP